MPSFFRELKQRRVYRVAIGYAVIAWLVIQISATVMPAYHAPEWILPTFITLVALGFPICFYYGFTGIACVVYYRRELFKSVRTFFLAGLIPVVGGLMLFGIGVKAFDYYSTAGNNYSKPLAGIETPILVGIGGLIVGVVLMFASWPFFRPFFSRRPGEAVDPAVLAGDVRARPVEPAA